ncbi:hypothetical protein [Chondromyces crocatus]|uniref:Uncharacterized protein n=1 Tax=Chondromyces crocatus TaxID=52 RepID=A0A0K1ERZ6_CHOCO|nr:hypothetical protein [Chondromyces crocatus]AKT43700.1 uncharacterized protein CMC5_079350 [Chondromyces crocatus]
MAIRPAVPYGGPLSIDLQRFEGVLVDHNQGALRGMRREQEGFADVETELERVVPLLGDALGVAAPVHLRIATRTALLKELREVKHHVDKLAEVLAETEASLENERETDIGLIASMARLVARRKDPSVLALFQHTIRYNSQISLRGAKTRRKRAAEAAAAALAREEARQVEADGSALGERPQAGDEEIRAEVSRIARLQGEKIKAEKIKAEVTEAKVEAEASEATPIEARVGDAAKIESEVNEAKQAEARAGDAVSVEAEASRAQAVTRGESDAERSSTETIRRASASSGGDLPASGKRRLGLPSSSRGQILAALRTLPPEALIELAVRANLNTAHEPRTGRELGNRPPGPAVPPD